MEGLKYVNKPKKSLLKDFFGKILKVTREKSMWKLSCILYTMQACNTAGHVPHCILGCQLAGDCWHAEAALRSQD